MSRYLSGFLLSSKRRSSACQRELTNPKLTIVIHIHITRVRTITMRTEKIYVNDLVRPTLLVGMAAAAAAADGR